MPIPFTATPAPADNSDYGAVARTADHLRLSQFDLFRLAYRRWYGHEPEPRALERAFGRYLTHGSAPLWVRQLARDVSGDGHDRERFEATDLPRRDGFPAGRPGPFAAFVFAAALIVYLALLA